MPERVLAWRGGERQMTDLAHLAEVPHETAHRERMGLPALLEWVTQECNGDRRSTERSRRLDSDAAAVQNMTGWVSQGLDRKRGGSGKGGSVRVGPGVRRSRK